MPQRQTRKQDIKAQYSDIFRWQREQLLAKKTLGEISESLITPTVSNAHGDQTDDQIEDRRLAFLQGLGKMSNEQYRQAHLNLKKDHDKLVNDIRTLHQLLAQPL